MARNATIKVTVRFDDNGKHENINILITEDPCSRISSEKALRGSGQMSLGNQNRSCAGEEIAIRWIADVARDRPVAGTGEKYLTNFRL